MRLLVFGNSGSGKTTLAGRLEREEGLAHLDLDTLAWLPVDPPERAPIAASSEHITRFTQRHERWVVEGCYADLLAQLAPSATHMIYMDLSVQSCQENAKSRGWEPHKYSSAAAQERNLAMLLDWIEAYDSRRDACSRSAHQQLYEQFTGRRIHVTSNEQSASLLV